MQDYESLELVYDVVRDLIQALEQVWSEGCLDENGIEVLSGCYSVCDYIANRLASLNREQDEIEEPRLIKATHYLASLDVLKQCESALARDLSDEICTSFIDYKKVNALVGFRKLISHIKELTGIIND